MSQLSLKYKDDSGEEKSVAVEAERFKIGRHSECDLTISDGRLSREHLKIERAGDDFEATDLGSSNGTKLNGEDLKGTIVLKDGDVLSLGGFEISVGIVAEDTNAEINASAPDNDNEAPPEAAGEAAAGAAVGAGMPQAAAMPSARPAAPAGEGFSPGLLLIAPLLGIIVLILVVGLIYLFSGSGSGGTNNSDDDEFVYTSDKDDDDDRPSKNKKDDNSSPGKNSSTSIPSGPTGNPGGTTTPGDPNPPVTPQNTTESGKVEQNGAAFLRRIAQNDPKAFLTGDQAQRVNSKVKQFSKSAALADNINSARKNATQLRSIASSKNLKPQFLAVAAISKLGNSRGDVVQTAQSIADVLDKLGTQIGNELADDALLMIAAYNQGVAGEDKKMRDMLQKLVNNSPDSARTIRTIWFLEKNGKITPGEFENALNFLAIGTISQNPKEFGVNAEALQL